MRAKSGGGLTSNKFVQPGIKTGSPNKATSPAAADQLGNPLQGIEGDDGAFLAVKQPSNHPHEGGEGGSRNSGNGSESVVPNADDPLLSKGWKQVSPRLVLDKRRVDRLHTAVLGVV